MLAPEENYTIGFNGNYNWKMVVTKLVLVVVKYILVGNSLNY